MRGEKEDGRREEEETKELPKLLPDAESEESERRYVSKRERLEAGECEIRENGSVKQEKRGKVERGETTRSVLEIPGKKRKRKEDGSMMCGSCCLQ